MVLDSDKGDAEDIWPGEGLEVSPETVDLDVLNDTFSYFIRDLNIALSRDWDARLEDIPEMRGTGKVSVLFLANKYPGIHPSTIAQIIMRDRAEITRMVTAMEKTGLVCRRPGRKDSRAWSLFLTKKGEAVLEKIRERVLQSRSFLSDISSEEYEQAMSILRKIYWRLVMTPRPAGGRS